MLGTGCPVWASWHGVASIGCPAWGAWDMVPGPGCLAWVCGAGCLGCPWWGCPWWGAHGRGAHGEVPMAGGPLVGVPMAGMPMAGCPWRGCPWRGCPWRGCHSRSAGDSSRTAPRAGGSRSTRQDTPSGGRGTAPGAVSLPRRHPRCHRVPSVGDTPAAGGAGGTGGGAQPLPGTEGWRFQAGKGLRRGPWSPVGDRQRPWARSQMVSWGQQWTLSAQHKACGGRNCSSQRWPQDVSPPQARMSPCPVPGAWGSTPRRRWPSCSTWHYRDTRTVRRDKGQLGGLRRAETG